LLLVPSRQRTIFLATDVLSPVSETALDLSRLRRNAEVEQKQ